MKIKLAKRLEPYTAKDLEVEGKKLAEQALII